MHTGAHVHVTSTAPKNAFQAMVQGTHWYRGAERVSTVRDVYLDTEVPHAIYKYVYLDIHTHTPTSVRFREVHGLQLPPSKDTRIKTPNLTIAIRIDWESHFLEHGLIGILAARNTCVMVMGYCPQGLPQRISTVWVGRSAPDSEAFCIKALQLK